MILAADTVDSVTRPPGQDDLSARIAQYRAALEGQPDSADLLLVLGTAHLLNRQLDEAIPCLRRAAALDPLRAETQAHLGLALNEKGLFRDALGPLRMALALDPTDTATLSGLGHAYRSLSRFPEARAIMLWAVRIEPNAAETQYYLGTILAALGLYPEAGAALCISIALNPGHADAYSNLGAVLLSGGLPNSEPALHVLARAALLDPDLPTAYSNLSVILSQRGDPDQAVPYDLRAAELAPSPEKWSRVLFNLNYCDSWTAEECAREHFRIGALFDAAGEPNRLPEAETRPEADRRYRIGFVSPDFRNHSVSYFLRPLMAAIDRNRFEIFCYSDVVKADEITAEIRAAADHWFDAPSVSDQELAQQIRADGIDILIDLAGHTPHNRMGSFALRPAPVQMTWLGYANTTGLKAIDYRIVDAVTDPVGIADGLASESLLRLENGFLCYGPPPYAPAPTVRETSVAGAVTFGTFNNPTKITDATFDLWSRLLNRLPRATLLIKSYRLRDEVLRNRILGKFAERGVAAGRLILLDANADSIEHLATYGQIDIGLDPVLYNGTTTTCEALWMGVPVIAQRGDRHAGRVGAGLLTQAGLTELIAESEDDYIEIACRLAEDPTRLARVRHGLRQRVADSSLCDAPSFARTFERALLGAYRKASAGRRAAAEAALGELAALLTETSPPMERIRLARNRLAGALLAESSAVPSVDKMAAICRSLTPLGLRTGPADAIEASLLARAHAGLDGKGAPVRFLLAHCLLAPPHLLPALPPLGALPLEQLVPLAAALLEEPLFWTRTGEAEAFAAHAEVALHRVWQALSAHASGAEAALRIAAACRLGAATVADISLRGVAANHARLVELGLTGQGLAFDCDFPPSRRDRPKLGCLRSRWEAGGDSSLAVSYLEGLADRFDIILYGTGKLGDTPFERRAKAVAGHVRELPDTVRGAVEAIRADDLDILLIGQDVSTNLTISGAAAAFRCARYQVAIATSPMSTGFGRIDAYLADIPGLPPASREDFTETLISPDTAPPLVDWIPEGPLPVRLTRGELGVPDGRVLMVSGAPLSALTPELLACWGAILKRRYDAHLLLYPFDQAWTGHAGLASAEWRIRALLAPQGGASDYIAPQGGASDNIAPQGGASDYIAPQGGASDRITILPPGVSKAGARAVLAIADLYLDAFPASDPATLLDPLAVDLPMLLYRGMQARCRRTDALLRAYDLPALASVSAEDYQEKAVALASSKDLRADLRRKAPLCRDRMRRGPADIGISLADAFSRRRDGNAS